MDTRHTRSHVLMTFLAAVALGLMLQGCASLSSSENDGASSSDPEPELKSTARGEEPNRGGSVDLATGDPQAALETMRVADGYAVNLFASEKQFPALRNPMAMAWDAQGRLWVATMPYYPQYLPGDPPNDKLLIFEDTDGDGRADEQTVFADSLYLPTGFELGDGGVYVAQEPNIMFLEDTDGDDKADVRKTILHGFGTGDSHHAIHAFTWGPGGGLYFQEGTFLYSQVETPYGPVRLQYGGVWRYEPRTERFRVHVSYPFANPWGHEFNYWGQNFVFDASGGANYFGLPITGRVDYPRKHPPMKVMTTVVRPTSGAEFISSPHFPDSVQGNLLINNVIGFQGIKHHKMMEEGSGYNSVELDPLLYSVDRNFRPVDMSTGPDGALYVVDWWNPLIGHMQYSIRDSRRDSSHGRIWRVTHEDRPLLDDPAIDDRPIPHLLDLLKEYTDRNKVRYRVRRELRLHESQEVAAALEQWIADLDPSDADYEHHLLEALWVYQSHDIVADELLRQLLSADNPRARAAATRVLRFWRDRVDGAMGLFEEQVNDDHPRVRLEAVVALSYFDSAAAAEIALQALRYPVDYYLDYGLRETMRTLEDRWKPRLANGDSFSEAHPTGIEFVLEQVNTSELVEMSRSEGVHPAVHRAVLSRDDVSDTDRTAALDALADREGQSRGAILLEVLASIPENSGGTDELTELLVSGEDPTEGNSPERLESLAIGGRSAAARQAAFAALLNRHSSPEDAWALAWASRRGLHDLLQAVPRANSVARNELYERIQPLIADMPEHLSDAPIQGNHVEVRAQNPAVEDVLPEIDMLGPSGAILGTEEDFERVRAGLWRAPLPSKKALHRIVLANGPSAYPGGSLDKYELRILGRSGTPIYRAVPSRAYYPSDNLAYDRITKGPMGGLPKTRPTGPAIPTRDTLDIPGGTTPHDIHRAAIRASASAGDHYAETFRMLKEQIAAGTYLHDAVAGMNQMPTRAWPEEELEGLGEDVLAAARKVPLEQRTDREFQEIVTFGLTLASRLPAEERAELEDALNSLIQIVVVETVEAEMRYDLEQFTVEAGKPVAIVLRNKDALQHNLVIVRPGTMKEVGLMADAMAGDPDAYDEGFIPDTDDVLWHTDLIGNGQTDQISFTAPEKPGAYPFECTFPGHWRTMNGIMKVVPAASADAASSR